jgi:hypothetical protein
MAPQQPVNPNFMTMLPILAQYMNRKGGANSGDMSNIFNELMGLMSNSYTPPSQISDEEIQRIYAPQTNAVRGSDDPVLQGILADIESGTPALKIKEAIRKGVYDTGTIQLSTPADLSMYDGLVDDLYSEKKSVDQERYKIANKETIYEKYGLPDPNEQFDPQQLFPDVYAGLDAQEAVAKQGVDARTKAIRDKYMPQKGSEPYRRSLSLEDLAKGKGFGYTDFASGKVDKSLFPKAKTTTDIQGYKTLASQLNEYAKGKPVLDAQATSDSGKSVFFNDETYRRKLAELEDMSGLKLKSPLSMTKMSSQKEKGNKAKMNYEMELAGAPATNLKVGNTGGAVTDLGVENLRDPVLQQQKIKELLTRRVQEGLAARGETPFNQALLNRIVLNTSMGK